jgi:hypothetical protein
MVSGTGLPNVALRLTGRPSRVHSLAGDSASTHLPACIAPEDELERRR